MDTNLRSMVTRNSSNSTPVGPNAERLVPREVDGLLLAGRCTSGSHDAHASYRVQCIAMATGIAAGAAAALAAELEIAPRAVAVKRIQEVVFAENPGATRTQSSN